MRISGAVLGFLIFLVGIGLLCIVFAQAHALFNAPPTALPMPVPAVAASAHAPAAASPSPIPTADLTKIGNNITGFIEQLLVLLVECIIASAVAALGINLVFKVTAAPRDHGPAPMHPQPTPPTSPPTTP